jgi:hypothetical protein
MPALKLFRGNWDGRNERAVACATKKEAMALLGTSAATMNNHFSQPDTVMRESCKAVWDSPRVVFHRRMRSTAEQDPWLPIKPG